MWSRVRDGTKVVTHCNRMDKSKKHSSGHAVMDNFDALHVHHSLIVIALLNYEIKSFL